MHPQFVVELSFFVMAPHFNFIAALRSGLSGRCKAWMVPDSLLFIVYQHLTSTNAQMYQCNARRLPHSCQDVELKQEETHPFKHTNKTLPKTQQIRALSVRVTKVKGSCSFFWYCSKKLSHTKLSILLCWCQIVRLPSCYQIIWLPNCPVPNCLITILQNFCPPQTGILVQNHCF